MKIKRRWIYLVLGLVIVGGVVGGVLWWRLGTRSLPPPSPRYNVVVEEQLQAEGVSVRATLVVMQLLSDVEGLAAVRHYLTQAPEADLYQLLIPGERFLALRSKTIRSPDAVPEQLLDHLAPWKKARRVAREGPYTIYRLE